MDPKTLGTHARIKSITGKHHAGWSMLRHMEDGTGYYEGPVNKGRHIADVVPVIGRHHISRPVTYDATGTTTPLNPPTHVLNVVA